MTPFIQESIDEVVRTPDDFSQRLARTVRSDKFTVFVNRDFDAVISGCAEPGP